METAIVAARAINGVIGRGLEIPWRVKGEQKLFKSITMGGTLIMGRRTHDAIGRPLPGRETIVISATLEAPPEGCLLASGLDQALAMAGSLGRPVFVAGGGEIYRLALPVTNTVHLTTINTVVQGDVVFPPFPTADFELISEQRFQSNIDYIYQVFRRRSAESTQSNQSTSSR